MNISTRNNTRIESIPIDGSQINRVPEQIYSTCQRIYALGIHKLSTSPNSVSKCLIEYIQGSYVAKLLDKSSSVPNLDASSVFVDTRKQEPFDWVKTKNAYQRIIHLSDLEDKWDGYTAPGFSKEQIDRALELYSSLRTYSIKKGINFQKLEPFIVPSSDGTILFEWAGKRFYERQLEIYVPREAHDLFEYLKTQAESEEEGKFTLEGLYHILDWLLKFDF